VKRESNEGGLIPHRLTVDSKFPPTLWGKPLDLLFPYTNNGAESYHSHLNAEFYVKHPNFYVFVDVMKKIQQSQQARKSKYEREKTAFVVSAYYNYHTQRIARKEFLKKVYVIVMEREPNCDSDSALRVYFILM